MPVSLPPTAALKEFLGPTTRHTRRVEIYESDGVTRWSKDQVARLKDGAVSVDYSRDERRTLDLTLSNTDGVLVNAPGEFWYDKIIKVYRGVQVREPGRLPKILIISDSTSTPLAPAFREMLVALGYGDVRINSLATDYYYDILPYDIIVGLGGTNKSALLKQAYEAGKSVIVMSDSSPDFITAVYGASYLTSNTPASTVAPQEITHPLARGWTSFNSSNDGTSMLMPNSSLAGSGQPTYTSLTTNTRAMGASQPAVGDGHAVYVNWRPTTAQFSAPQFRNFMISALDWLNPVELIDVWETQIGEFMIDRISEAHFPHDVKITGRDYTKKCLLSKYAFSTQFDAGQTLEAVIASIAGAAGITKRILPVTGITIGRSFFFDRNVSRWEAMKEICTAYDYEIFFDATGYLVIRPYRDPATTPPVIYLETGKNGQLASYEKSTTDTRIFNHVLITGESSDTAVIPVWAERKNESASSPTSIAEIGDRFMEFSSAFIQTQAQADALADTYISLHSLEEFELSFDSLMLPWLEAGDIMGWIDPDPAPGDPDTFLLYSMNIPLKLGTMSSTAKRVTNVGV